MFSGPSSHHTVFAAPMFPSLSAICSVADTEVYVYFICVIGRLGERNRKGNCIPLAHCHTRRLHSGIII